MTDFAPDRPHPIPGMVANPEWEVTLTKRAELYLAERARRADPEREPSSTGAGGIFLAIIGGVIVAASLIGGVL